MHSESHLPTNWLLNSRTFGGPWTLEIAEALIDRLCMRRIVLSRFHCLFFFFSLASLFPWSAYYTNLKNCRGEAFLQFFGGVGGMNGKPVTKLLRMAMCTEGRQCHWVMRSNKVTIYETWIHVITMINMTNFSFLSFFTCLDGIVLELHHQCELPMPVVIQIHPVKS